MRRHIIGFAATKPSDHVRMAEHTGHSQVRGVRSFAITLSLASLFAVLLALGAGTPAFAAPSGTHAAPIGQVVSSTSIPLYVDCTHIPDTAAAHSFLKAHNLCGYSSGGVTPKSSVSGNCGTLTNWLSNAGGGDAQTHVRITVVWYFGPIYSASWSGRLYNYNTHSTLGAGNIRIGPFGWSLDDYQYYYTDTGRVGFTVDFAIATNLAGLQCTNAGVVYAETNVS